MCTFARGGDEVEEAAGVPGVSWAGKAERWVDERSLPMVVSGVAAILEVKN